MNAEAEAELISPETATRSIQIEPFLKTGCAAAILVVIYHSVISGLFMDWWTEPALSYGLLVPPLAGYIIWMRQGLLLSEPVSPDNRGLWVIASACVLQLAGSLGAEEFLCRISLLAQFVGLTLTFWGLGRLRVLLFPLTLFATSIPLPAVVYQSLTAPLQLLASHLASVMAQGMGVTLLRDGNIVYLAGASLGVSETCSGLNSLYALATGSLLLGFALGAGIKTRIALALFSIPLAVAMNIFRIAGTALLADYRPSLAMGFYHLFSGWIVFLVSVMLLYFLGRLIMKLAD